MNAARPSGHLELLLLGAALVLAGGAGIGLSEVRLGGLVATIGVGICLRSHREWSVARGVVGAPAPSRGRSTRDGVEVLLAGLLVAVGLFGLMLNGLSRPVGAVVELAALVAGVRLLASSCRA